MAAWDDIMRMTPQQLTSTDFGAPPAARQRRPPRPDDPERGGAAVLPDPPEIAPRRRRRASDDDEIGAYDSMAKGYYTGAAIPIVSSAGPRAADYAQRANLGLDAAGRPLVGPGVGGYASPRETDNAVETFLDTAAQDQMAAAMNQRRMASLIARLGQYR
jgi:hypothetical protein